MRLSVVIPAYNERATIRQLVAAVMAVNLDGLDRELVIVDDGSTDGTRDILKELDGRDGVRVVLQPRNFGKGAAVARGFKEATGDILVIQDADLEYDPQQFPVLLRPILDQRADVVFGSRFLGQRGRASCAVLLALGRQQAADAPVERRHRPQSHRHGNLLQDDDEADCVAPRSAVAAFRRRA